MIQDDSAHLVQGLCRGGIQAETGDQGLPRGEYHKFSAVLIIVVFVAVVISAWD